MLYSQVKEHKSKHLDDLMDTIRQMILIKWNQRKRIVQKFEGKILPHIVQKLRDDSYNLDIEVITSSPDGIAEICAKEREATAYRFVVNLVERTCTCRAWQGSGIPCKHAIAYITPGGRRKNRMKSALEGGSTSKKRKKCPICHDFGHHWYKCKNGNPEDIAAMEAVR